MLGKEQDSVGGGFVSSQSFQGSLTNVNVWSSVLSGKTIKSMSTSCRAVAEDASKWSDFIYGIKGKTALVIPARKFQHYAFARHRPSQQQHYA